jgi:septal ring-binding cell division protein DamX
MNPSLVEPSIKYILNGQLGIIKENSEKNKNLMFNIGLFVSLVSIIFIILRLKYKGKQNIQEQIIKENKKKNYILSNLRKYQNMKSQPLTNIPIN